MDKRSYRELQQYMADYGMPKIAEIILDVAKSVAMEMGDINDPFIMDEAGEAVIKEVAQFLAMADFVQDYDTRLLHPRQLTSDHYRTFWGVSKSKTE